ncbi:MAG: CDP-diacylglycerol--glycerol-3-phosphate 3-phosphatidyltransferase [Devosia sp.]
MHGSTLTSLPNLITIGRILLIPVICWLLATGNLPLRAVALALYAAAAVSDWLDGYLARRLKLGSPLGRMLDPIADKLLIGALLVVLAWNGSFSELDLVPAIAILLREIFVSGLREFLGPRNVVVHVTTLAKWKTMVQLVALGIVILEALVPGWRLASDIALWLAAILTVWTGVQYFAGAWPHLLGDQK